MTPEAAEQVDQLMYQAAMKMNHSK